MSRSEMQPIVLIGAARSGTKFVRDLLAASPEVAAVPYDVNYIWRHGNESCPHDELTPDMVPERTRSHIRGAIERLARRNGGPDARFFVEKTVSNSLRPDLVRAVYPDAKVVYLERDGFDVTESSIRQWRAPTDRRYLLDKIRYFPLREWRYAVWFARNTLTPSDTPPIWGPRYDGIDEELATFGVPHVCARQWLISVHRWADRLDRSGTEVEITYRSLFGSDGDGNGDGNNASDNDGGSEGGKNSASAVRDLAAAVGIDDTAHIERWFADRAAPVIGTWPGELDADEITQVESVLGSRPIGG